VLFDGTSTDAWRRYKGQDFPSNWKIVDKELVLEKAEAGSDIITKEKFDWFELIVEFNLNKDQNSGLIFRATEQGNYAWQSGPEVQLYDHPVKEGVQTTGYLYELYSAPELKPKPAGEWNVLRLVVAPSKSFVELNGVRGFEFEIGSEDFNSRVAKSKFRVYPYFAKAKEGHIALQGDHGTLKFRNIKIRPLKGS
jgi:hypothetical protein